jgi:sterol desaturase/sphingolipid hydroxylase (fatty acid hydroxylase superfamily)
MHRFFGHRRTRLTFSKDHLQHHRDPTFFISKRRKISRAAQVFLFLTAIGYLPFGIILSLAFSSGFILLYGWYEWVHYSIHAHAPRSAYGRWARKHHLYHHFGNMKINHGLTSPLWDVVFGTHVPATVVKIPSKKADSWLKSAIEAASPADWLEDYQLIRAR